jgi:hypothetical protein
MSQWFITFDGQQLGPLGHAQAVAEAFQHPGGFAWREHFTEWVPLTKVIELRPQSTKRPVHAQIAWGRETRINRREHVYDGVYPRGIGQSEAGLRCALSGHDNPGNTD